MQSLGHTLPAIQRVRSTVPRHGRTPHPVPSVSAAKQSPSRVSAAHRRPSHVPATCIGSICVPVEQSIPTHDAADARSSPSHVSGLSATHCRPAVRPVPRVCGTPPTVRVPAAHHTRTALQTRRHAGRPAVYGRDEARDVACVSAAGLDVVCNRDGGRPAVCSRDAGRDAAWHTLPAVLRVRGTHSRQQPSAQAFLCRDLG